MPATDTPHLAYEDILAHAGFFRQDQPLPDLMWSGDVLRSELSRDEIAEHRIERAFRYQALLRPVDQGGRLGLTHVYELSGSPCVVFKRLDAEPSATELTHQLFDWQRAVWNHGRAPVLWVVTPTQVRILDAYARPPNPDLENLSCIEIYRFERIAEQLDELRARASRDAIESGRFWSDLGKSIDRKSRVDAQLIKDLSSTAERLKERGLALGEAHRLLLRSLFTGYLHARGWLGQEAQRGLRHAANFHEMMGSPAETQELFTWLAETFNGDIFPSTEEIPAYTPEQLRWVQFFLQGGDPATGQQYLWPYDLKVLPVELLSSIYEKFAHALDPNQARARSTHYTPVNLVDLALSEVFDDSHFDNRLPLGAKVLDLSCGSGVFLVEALRRLVGRRLAAGERWTRKLVRNTLYNQVFGVDINAGAVHIAAVSLYLAALELDPNPQQGNGIKFEPLVRPAALQRRSQRLFFNLHAANAFDIEAPYNHEAPFAEKAFDVVVGNPPWTRPRGMRAAGGASAEEENRHIDYCTSRGIPLAYRNPPDQAFIWRATELAVTNARVSFFLSAQRFFSRQPASKKASRALLSHVSPTLLLNLSSLRRERIFPSSNHPAIMLIALNRQPRASENLTFLSPARQKTLRKNGLFSVDPDQVKILGLRRILSGDGTLRVGVWGQARDLALINRVRNDSLSLNESLSLAGSGLKQGFIRGTRRVPVPEEFLKRRLPCLEKQGFFPFAMDSHQLPRFGYSELEHLRDPKIYSGPLLVIKMSPERSRLAASICQDDLVYSRRYSGAQIRGSSSNWWSAILGILNSQLASYFIFMSSPEWGVERDNIYSDDLLHLPVPSAERQDDSLVQRVAEISAHLRQVARQHQEVPGDLLMDLDHAVFDLYRLDPEERILIEDMVSTTIDLYRKAEDSIWMGPACTDEVAAYAITFARVIDGFLKVRDQNRLAAEIYEVPQQSSLRVVRFAIAPQNTTDAPPQRIIPMQDLGSILDRIAELLPDSTRERVYVERHLRIYGDRELYIVKPNRRHLWTRSSGLNDADTVIAEHLRS